jgi:5-formyltetrahydrofolate cyclo-ligase
MFRNPEVVFIYPSVKENNLHAIIVNERTAFAPNEYGIDEPVNGTEGIPQEIDMVFVPLLAFDNRGYRVGYGKGYYDRFLRTCSPDVLKIGFSFFEAEPEIGDVNEYDIPLDICITPGKVYTFIN